MKRIFISYSRQDLEFAKRVAKSLGDLGADVWIDYEDIPAGQKWSTAIQQGLDSSDGLLVLISPEAMASRNVEDEWQYFLDSGRPIIPILYKPAKIHFQLNRLQYVDFSTQRFGDAFAKLLDELTLKGIPIQVEAVEETWIYDVRRSKPPQKEPEAAQQSSSQETMPSIKIQKSMAPRKTQKPKETPAFMFLASILLGFSLVLGLGLSIYYFFSTLSSPAAQLSDFAQQPFSLYFYNEDYQVHQESNEDVYAYFDSIYILERFLEEGRVWYQLYDVDTGELGYQTADNLPASLGTYYLRIVPFSKIIPNTALRLYTRPALNASSFAGEVRESILVYGYRYDEAEKLWYYVYVETDGAGYMGWIPAESDHFGLVGDIPVIAYTTTATQTAWDEALEDPSLTIPSGELLYLVARHANNYMVALIHDEAWLLLWVDGSKLDINAASRQFLEQK